MQRYKWSHLNNQQTGAYTEYFVKMELSMYGFEVYTTEIDDRGIDFVARKSPGPFLEIQVKSLRSFGYVFMEKTKIKLHEHSYVALGLLFEEKPPALYMIPATIWVKPQGIFVDRKYEGLKSKAEWGINISKKNMPELEPYIFDKMVDHISSIRETNLDICL